jgi:hypothetical protein
LLAGGRLRVEDMWGSWEGTALVHGHRLIVLAQKAT